MRIIAGTHRGRPLVGPKDDKTTRPITDRVKETLFNRLHSLGVLGYGRAVDVFCGTGSMGLEALSRGAAHGTFVDRDRDAVSRLQQNLEALQLADRAEVITGGALPALWATRLPEASVTLVFLDPPYAMVEADADAMAPLFTALLPKLEPGGVVVYRTPPEIDAGEVEGYDGPTRATYGGMAIHFYQRPMDEEAGALSV